MPVITADKLQSNYDVVIVGSGAGGGQTAYTLTMEGVKVLMIEAGRSFDPCDGGGDVATAESGAAAR
jgi:choline dehydrogenase-like flavoprotein